MASDISSSLETKKDSDKQLEKTATEDLASSILSHVKRDAEGKDQEAQGPGAQRPERQGAGANEPDSKNASEEVLFESSKRFNYDADALEDLLKAGVEKKSNWFPFQSSCDTLPQSPKLSNKTVVDTCDIELSDIYERSRDSVVKIQLSDGSSGTGFLVCDDNTCAIATNAHVVDDYSRVTVISNTHQSAVARVSQVDKKNDLALIEFNSTRLSGVRPLPLLKTEQVSAEPVFTIGHSRGLDNQVISAGRIKNPDTWTYTSGTGGKTYYEKYIQSNLEIYPGNSGGPLINGKGAVVGVIAARSRNVALGPNAESLRELLSKERQKV